jgi:hypothetical protein
LLQQSEATLHMFPAFFPHLPLTQQKPFMHDGSVMPGFMHDCPFAVLHSAESLQTWLAEHSPCWPLVTCTHVPGVGDAQDSHWPVHASLQHTPSAQREASPPQSVLSTHVIPRTQESIVLQSTHFPSESHTSLEPGAPQSVPFGFGGNSGESPLHCSIVQGLPSSAGKSFGSASEVELPLASHTFILQSDAVCGGSLLLCSHIDAEQLQLPHSFEVPQSAPLFLLSQTHFPSPLHVRLPFAPHLVSFELNL